MWRDIGASGLNPDDALHLWRSEFLDEKQCVLWAYNNGQGASRYPQMEVSSENLLVGKAHSCSEQVVIPAKSNRCPFHDGSGLVKSTHHQLAGSPLGSDVLLWGSWAYGKGWRVCWSVLVQRSLGCWAKQGGWGHRLADAIRQTVWSP